MVGARGMAGARLGHGRGKDPELLGKVGARLGQGWSKNLNNSNNLRQGYQKW